eukprot:6913508-Prymnesium_polylepis.2
MSVNGSSRCLSQHCPRWAAQTGWSQYTQTVQFLSCREGPESLRHASQHSAADGTTKSAPHRTTSP